MQAADSAAMGSDTCAPSDAFKPAGDVAPVRRDYITASIYPIAAAITARLARVLSVHCRQSSRWRY